MVLVVHHVADGEAQRQANPAAGERHEMANDVNPPLGVERLVIWLFGRVFVFRHESGATHAVRARSPEAATRKMRSFLVGKMFGDWALTYDPVAVDRELAKCQIVDDDR